MILETTGIKFKQFEIFTPKQALLLESEKLMNVATQAQSLIQQLGGEHMEHHTPDALYAYLRAGMACYAENSKKKLGGFIKVNPWLYKQDDPSVNDLDIFKKLELTESGTARLAALETSSLVVHPDDQGQHLGKELKILMAAQASAHFPGIPVIAVIDNTNEISIINNYDRGWIPVDSEVLKTVIGVDVLLGWKPRSTIFMSPESYKEFTTKI